MRIKAVLIDFDGTIANTLDLHYSAFKKVLEKIGIKISKKFFSRKIFGLTDRVALAAFANAKAQILENLIKEKRKIFLKNIKKIKLYPGTKKFLEWLKKRLKIALVTSLSYEETKAVLKALDLEHYFNSVSCGEKRKRVLFADALARLGVKPSQAIAIEDSITGARAAKSGGMKTVLIARPWNKTMEFKRISSWKILKNKLSRLY